MNSTDKLKEAHVQDLQNNTELVWLHHDLIHLSDVCVVVLIFAIVFKVYRVGP